MTTKKPTFVLMLPEEMEDRFLLIRNVEGYATHYLGPDGMWVSWPAETEEELETMFESLTDPDNLPAFDLVAAKELNEGLDDD